VGEDDRAVAEPQPGAVGVPVDALQVLDAPNVVARLGEGDPHALTQPQVDVRLAGVVGGERELLVPVPVEEMAQIPGAVADVDLRVVEIRDAEGLAAGANRDPFGGDRLELHQPDRSGLRLGICAELALGVDHRGEQVWIEMVVAGMTPDDRVVAERVPQPLVPRWLGRIDDHERDPECGGNRQRPE